MTAHIRFSSHAGSNLEWELSRMLALAGLTIEESEEFARLDDSVPFDGAPVWPSAEMPRPQGEQRWLELWSRHAAASVGLRGVQEIVRN